MSTRILKRDELAQMLREWQAGQVSTEQLLRWANALDLSDEVDFEDWEGDDSVTNEVLAALDMLDMNLALPEDAPVYLAFLATPSGQFQSGYAEYQRALSAVDLVSRRKKLRGVPLYERFLQNQPQQDA
jgi:hypothetical protein